DFSGRYIHYGVREFAMAAAMNGMALHGGVLPYGGTFLVFTDYARPAIRLSALMGQRVIYVMTHDSIGLGEDGPTHQPIEHLMSLRAMPNLLVLRPADVVETAECWQVALAQARRPSVLALSRQSLPQLRLKASKDNRCAKGGYVLKAVKGTPDVALLATGSEVSVAMQAADLLAARGVKAQVSSLPSWELFDAQPAAYRRRVLGGDGLKVSIEAGATLGWRKYVGADGIVLGIDGFGASAPGKNLFRHFRLTPERVVAEVAKRL
ncbi:MAG: transketolase, partial [Alphaproteobacteria bacterium]